MPQRSRTPPERSQAAPEPNRAAPERNRSTLPTPESAPANAESSVNVQLAEVLRSKHPDWRKGIGAEQSRVFRDAARRPDLIVHGHRAQPVAVETEFPPGRGVEADALARLGEAVGANGDEVEQAVGVLLPEELRTGQDRLQQRTAEAVYRYAVFSGAPDKAKRWPRNGWMLGDIDDLAACIEHASLSERKIAESAEVLERGVQMAAGKLKDMALGGKKNTLNQLARALHQEASDQTTRMAMAVIANAMTFHEAIAGAHDLPSLADLRVDIAPDLPDTTGIVICWRRILLEINYWPIFSIAADLLAKMPLAIAIQVVLRLERVAQNLSSIGGVGAHDLSGQVFQRLIADRKFLATFYTLPASATLLAELAVPRLQVDWSDSEELGRLRMADLACGTGTLLNAAYHSVRRRHRRTGGDDALLHPTMMEQVLVAADIMPAATHLTASALSGAHPAVPFSNTRIVTMPYGEQPSETGHPLSIGSLDLLVDERARSLMETTGPALPGGQRDVFGTGRRQVRGTGKAEEASDQHLVDLPHESGDLLIMNPPFTRPTNHESTTIPVPSFAGFDTSRDEQRAMSGRLAKLRKQLDAPAGAGNAGLASHFVDLAHVKTKPGGVIALVLPAAFVQGSSWAGARRLMEAHYQEIVVMSVAASGSTDRAFSADTGMAEVLVVATKKHDRAEAAGDVLFVNLLRRPRSLAEGAAVASAVRRLPSHSRGRIVIGDDDMGAFVRAPLAQGGCAALREPLLADAMRALENGELRLPRTTRCRVAPVTRLGDLGRRGKLDRDISGKHPDGTPRGPFNVFVARERPIYPMLWSHEAERERSLVVTPRQEGVVREDLHDQAAELWETTASRLHFNRDFQLNSQSLAACMTPERSIGGRAWPNFVADEQRWEKPLAVWANSTLGLMCFWWMGMRQQQGRAMLTISRLPDLLVLDPRRLSDKQINRARHVFDRNRDRRMLPANEAYRDEARHELDRALLIDVLGLPEELMEPLTALRDTWCAEPTVHGGKATRRSS